MNQFQRSERANNATQAATQLRQEFRSAFERPREAGERREEMVALLTFRIGRRPVALRVDQLDVLTRKPRVSRVPSFGGDSALLGVAGVWGRLVPVFSLAVLLGDGASEGESRWMALVGGIAVTFPDYQSNREIPVSGIPEAGTDGVSNVEIDGEPWTLADLRQLLKKRGLLQ